MNRFIALLSAIIISFTAYAQREVTVFTASDNLAKPIKLKAGGSTYTLYDEVRINKHVNSFQAWDANGNKIMPPSKSREYHSNSSKTNVTRYHFTTLYPQSQYSSKSSSVRDQSSSSYSPGEGDFEPDYQPRSSGSYTPSGWVDGNIQLGAQISTFHGESLVARVEVGGFTITGGVGKNFFRKDTGSTEITHRPIGWFAAGGIHFGDNDYHTALMVGYGNRQWDGSKYLFAGVDCCFYFSKHFGAIGGASIGIANKLALEAHIGIVARLYL